MKQLRGGLAIGTAALIGLLISSQARADVTLSGPDSNAGTYSSAGLSTLAAGGDSVSSDGLTGISLWSLLGGAPASSPASPIYGDITTSTPAGDNGKNAILRYFVLCSNTAGQQSVVSVGEIDPSFGGTAPNQAFIAYRTAGGSLLATPTLVVPGVSGRDLTDLTNLQLLAVPALATGGGGPSTSVQLSGAVINPGNYTKADLVNDFTPAIEPISGDLYTGVPLWTFLDPINSAITSQVVDIEATDGYEVAASLAELDPSLGGNPSDLLPYADSGTDFPGDGVARTIFPHDNKHGRWVSNVDALEVFAVPEPRALIPIGAGMIAMALARCRHRRLA